MKAALFQNKLDCTLELQLAEGRGGDFFADVNVVEDSSGAYVLQVSNFSGRIVVRHEVWEDALKGLVADGKQAAASFGSDKENTTTLANSQTTISAPADGPLGLELYQDDNGLIRVEKIDYFSPLGSQLEIGDVILGVNGQKVNDGNGIIKSLDEVIQILAKPSNGASRREIQVEKFRADTTVSALSLEPFGKSSAATTTDIESDDDGAEPAAPPKPAPRKRGRPPKDPNEPPKKRGRGPKRRLCQHPEGCTKSAVGKTDFCVPHGGGTRCSMEGCSTAAVGKAKAARPLCIKHGGGRRCEMEGCNRRVISKNLCKLHGGIVICDEEGCTQQARPGGLPGKCYKHGGGYHCCHDGCDKQARHPTPFCCRHGGGPRCQSDGCSGAVINGTLFCGKHGGWQMCMVSDCANYASKNYDFCIRHGGGKRCKFVSETGVACRTSVHAQGLCKNHGGRTRSDLLPCLHPGCEKRARSGGLQYCCTHGGGQRCKIDGCDKWAYAQGLCKGHGGKRKVDLQRQVATGDA